MMKIILDMDEVIVDMMTPLLKQYNEKYQSDIVLDDITQWGLPEDMEEIFQCPWFFYELKPLPGAIGGVRKLLSMGHDIILATDNCKGGVVARDKVLWVKKYLPELAGSMMVGARKDVLQGDCIIDDNPEHLINSPCRIKICMDRPWNRKWGVLNTMEPVRQYVYGFEFYRVHNWQQIPVLFAGDADGKQ